MSVLPNADHSRSGQPDSSGPAAILDACGVTCGCLEQLIATEMRRLAPGDVLEIRADRTEAADGIAAWVRLTGHTLVAIERGEPVPRARYLVRKKTPRT